MDGQGRETRLYVYADQATQTIHLITIGDKDSQSDDVKECSGFIRTLKKEQANG